MQKGRERAGKWYFRNEIEVMEELGLEPTPGSGSGWKHKEDGENEQILAQLKSTDKSSYKLNQLDLEKLEYNAGVANKVPLFILQFLNKDTRYALTAIEDIPKIAEYINTGKINMPDENYDIDLEGYEEMKPKKKSKISSSKSAREKFYEDKRNVWEERKWK